MLPKDLIAGSLYILVMFSVGQLFGCHLKNIQIKTYTALILPIIFFLYVQNLVFQINGRMYTEGFQVEGVMEDIWV